MSHNPSEESPCAMLWIVRLISVDFLMKLLEKAKSERGRCAPQIRSIWGSDSKKTKNNVKPDDGTAMTKLGWLYEPGKGVAQDYGHACELYQKAADAGNAHAMKILGVAFCDCYE
jgi:TPR repeat protein